MTHSFKLSRRIARLRAPVLATIAFTLISCNNTDSLDPSAGDGVSQTSPTGVDATPADAPSFGSASASRGIAFGNFAQPAEAFGSRFSGALRNESPQRLVKLLQSIKSRGGRVMLFFASSQKYYVDGSGHFDMDKWKDRVARYKGVNIAPYIEDGTIIGHMLIDEPNDPANWNGRPVSASTVEEMAKFSKSLWPNLPTLARVAPSYLNSNNKYLDGAWAQYLWRRGDVKKYIAESIEDAQKRGLSLVVGLNILHGGNPQGTRMTASEVESYGSALLSSSYPCAFLNWKYESGYVSSVGQAMDKLRAQADNRANKSCRST